MTFILDYGGKLVEPYVEIFLEMLFPDVILKFEYGVF